MMRYFALFFIVFLIVSCKQSPKQLPVLGEPVISGKDTIYPTIADFSLIDQEGRPVTNRTFADKIYVADFIFLSCPTICPVMTKAMQEVYAAFATNEKVDFISYTIDPQHDSIPRLKAYADKLKISPEKWHFLTGNQDSILFLAQHSYFSTAFPDSTAPGGFTHSGGLLLVDKDRHIRGVYNSTKSQETQRLIDDIKTLLKEQF